MNVDTVTTGGTIVISGESDPSAVDVRVDAFNCYGVASPGATYFSAANDPQLVVTPGVPDTWTLTLTLSDQSTCSIYPGTADIVVTLFDDMESYNGIKDTTTNEITIVDP